MVSAPWFSCSAAKRKMLNRIPSRDGVQSTARTTVKGVQNRRPQQWIPTEAIVAGPRSPPLVDVVGYASIDSSSVATPGLNSQGRLLCRLLAWEESQQRTTEAGWQYESVRLRDKIRT